MTETGKQKNPVAKAREALDKHLLGVFNANPDQIKEILLEVGGPQYNIHEPRTWPKQALLAHEGKWAELKKYQDELNAGK